MHPLNWQIFKTDVHLLVREYDVNYIDTTLQKSIARFKTVMKNMLGLVKCLMWTCILCVADSSPGSDNSSIGGDTVDGEMLVKLGRRMKLPMLTLIGSALRHSCSDWTQWTACSSIRYQGYFGNRNRSRTCNDMGQDNISTTRTEEDFQVCEGFCPRNYNLTENGTCLKLYAMLNVWDEGEKMCENDGGHLVYIDSDKKFSDVKKMIEGVNYSIWIDGRRKDTSSPWETVNGVKLTKFYWKSGQPNNGSTEFCLVMENSSTREWYDVVCNTNRYSLCEITV